MELSHGPAATDPGPPERFSGNVYLDNVATAGPPSLLRVLRVRFSPGARTAWHMHVNGQVLHVVDGTGLVQAKDGEVQRISSGDTVIAPPGEWHWHGATAETFMAHLAIHVSTPDGEDAQWGDHLTASEYDAAQAAAP